MSATFTEELFREAFSDRALLTSKAAAQLLGLDEKTLTALVLDGKIRSVAIGKQRRFSEAALRDFLHGTAKADESLFRGGLFSERHRSKAQRP